MGATSSLLSTHTPDRPASLLATLPGHRSRRLLSHSASHRTRRRPTRPFTGSAPYSGCSLRHRLRASIGAARLKKASSKHQRRVPSVVSWLNWNEVAEEFGHVVRDA